MEEESPSKHTSTSPVRPDTPMSEWELLVGGPRKKEESPKHTSTSPVHPDTPMSEWGLLAGRPERESTVDPTLKTDELQHPNTRRSPFSRLRSLLGKSKR